MRQRANWQKRTCSSLLFAHTLSLSCMRPIDRRKSSGKLHQLCSLVVAFAAGQAKPTPEAHLTVLIEAKAHPFLHLL